MPSLIDRETFPQIWIWTIEGLESHFRLVYQSGQRTNEVGSRTGKFTPNN